MGYAIKKKRDGKFTVADYLAWAALPDVLGAEEIVSLMVQKGMDIPLGEIFEAEPPKFLDT